MNPELKSLTLELKSVDDGDPNGEFEAILSTPDVDRDGESVAVGAFNPLPKSIPVHFAHDFIAGAAPVGKAEPFYDGDTLKVRGTFAPTARAQEMRQLVNGGFITAMSAGFLATKRKGKTILTGDLIEGSLTATPINTRAVMLASKALVQDAPADMTDEDVAVAEAVAEIELKAGARNSAADASLIQSMHDLAVALGASCDPAEEAAEMEPMPKSVDDLTVKAEEAAEPAAEEAADSAADQLERDRQRVRVWQAAVI